MKQKNISAVTAFAFAATLALAACGGGGGGGGDSSSGTNNSSTGSTAPSASTGNVTTPQYAAGSVQLAMFNQLNAYRQQCGLPALVDNTILDQATQAHAQYEADNNVVSDSETAGNTGFTGALYVDRAVHAGFPSGISVGGASGGFYTGQTYTADQLATQLLAGWFGGVYHSGVVMGPAVSVGFGEVEKATAGATQAWYAVSVTGSATLSNAPLTFPCEGVTGVPYSEVGGEVPTPPNTSGAWGTPVAVVGGLNDVVRLTAASMVDSSGTNIALQLLDSSNDTNKVLQPYQATAYPAVPLAPNTKYTVTLSGTINGTSFSRSFSFTTGNLVG
ncbi:CAP domain-containing protein [Paraburkholderia tropica]|uniref:CAP domain-containing protein n=1 Tax=Paraburkholderia tropica TaxID=92647 RepID=UPI0007EDCC21|nr:CAP domain-containing protein [Paraburkholderia tropica]OBR54077.1 serine protease [Paraburkholderia tropica]